MLDRAVSITLTTVAVQDSFDLLEILRYIFVRLHVKKNINLPSKGFGEQALAPFVWSHHQAHPNRVWV